MDLDDEIRKAQAERRAAAGVGLTDFGSAFDTDVYGSSSSAGFVRELVDEEEDAGMSRSSGGTHAATRAANIAQRVIAEHRAGGGADDAKDPMAEYRQLHGSGLANTRISDRESSYHARKREITLSPERGGGSAADGSGGGGYAERMREQALAREKQELMRKLQKQREEGIVVPAGAAAAVTAAAPAASAVGGAAASAAGGSASSSSSSSVVGGRKRKRWDDGPSESAGGAAAGGAGAEVDVSDAASTVSGASGLTFRTGFTSAAGTAVTTAAASASGATGRRRRGGWDEPSGDAGGAAATSAPASASVSAGGDAHAAALEAVTRSSRGRNRWDETPVAGAATGSAMGDASSTPALSAYGAGGGDATPAYSYRGGDDEYGAAATPAASSGVLALGSSSSGGLGGPPKAKRSRWDETPVIVSGGGLGAAGGADATPAAAGAYGATPAGGGLGAYGGATPTPSALAGAATPSLAQLAAASSSAAGGATPDLSARGRAEAEMEHRNRPLSDEELDSMFPTTGYRILEPPATYVPLRTPSRKLTATPTPMSGGATGFRLTETPSRDAYGVPATPGEQLGAAGAAGAGPGGPGGLPFIKPEDMQYFGALLDGRAEEELEGAEAKERKIMALLLKIKAGAPPQRKAAMRTITDKARELGAGPLFNQLLPLFRSPSLEDQERHVLVKVIDRVLFKLGDAVRPYVHKILMVIEPMLIDEDYFARIEGREIIANLAKAAGLATMVSTMRPDIDHAEEYVRNITARAFAVVASALGPVTLLPFLRAVCASKKTWQARHTGLKVIQQMAMLMGPAVLPHLAILVETCKPGLEDEDQKVRIMAALAIAALAESSAPYGIEAFDCVLRPLWNGVKKLRGKPLAAFMKAMGFVIPLMDPQYASDYTRGIMPTVISNFGTPEDEMKRIVLKVVTQCVAVEGVDPDYVRTEILPPFFASFWVRRMALDRRNYKALVETTVSIAGKVGANSVIATICDDLKDESEPYRRMVLETVQRVITAQGASDIGPRLEEQLVDGLLYAFQEQSTEDAAAAKTMLAGFGAVVNALGIRTKPYLLQIASTIKWRLNNKSPQVRQQAADLISRIAGVMRMCGEDALLGHLGVVLFECLGEEYPDVLGAILGGLKSIVAVIGMTSMQPPIKDLLPRLTPILKNRQEKVQENCIDLVGRIADRGAEFVPPKEWMRICFDLLEMLKANKKAIRRACVNTFGYIAKAIGPQDVLHALLNNLKVQERQLRVCTTVAIGIVAETCQPFFVLPALMNEYRTPDMNVQNGVLKALSFMFEYIGELARDYVHAVLPLLEDALIERDFVHRQTACFAIKHLTLGLQGLGCEDALQHLLNYVWPNIFETFPHVIQAVSEAIEALRVSLGPHRILQYTLQGLFHPARRVREAYWKIYNNTYVYAADALTPIYPALADEGVNRYTRTYLELLV